MSRMIKHTPQYDVIRRTVHMRRDIDRLMADYGCYAVGSRNGSSFSGRMSYDGKTLSLYTAQKLRRKVEHQPLKRKPRNVKGQTFPPLNYSPVLVREAHWELRIFRFPMDRIVSAKQLLHTFRIVLK